jgi:hypothetical protein
LQLADSTHQWFYYPLRYRGKSFDDYEAKGFGKSLDGFARIILYLEIIISLLSIGFLIYLLFKYENEA